MATTSTSSAVVVICSHGKRHAIQSILRVYCRWRCMTKSPCCLLNVFFCFVIVTKELASLGCNGTGTRWAGCWWLKTPLEHEIQTPNLIQDDNLSVNLLPTTAKGTHGRVFKQTILNDSGGSKPPENGARAPPHSSTPSTPTCVLLFYNNNLRAATAPF